MKPILSTLLLVVPFNLHGQATGSPEAAGLRNGTHQVVVNDVRLWYRVAGRTTPGVPPVVFLHGGPGQGSYHFGALVGPYMERSLRMVYFDQRGSGNSERPWTGAYAMATLVQDIEGLRRELGVPQIALIGHSFGGVLALEYAAAYPDRLASLVFVSGVWNAPLQGRYRCERTRAVYATLAPRGDSIVTGPADKCDWYWKIPGPLRDAINNALMFPDSTVRLRLDSTVAASHLRNTGELSGALLRAGLFEDYHFTSFARLTMPVLVISGRHDGASVPEGLRELARHLPNATFADYERSGHFVYLDEPERFARDATAFVTAASAAHK